MKLTVSQIAEMAGGELLSGDGSVLVTTFFTDSRCAAPGKMFVPIRGEKNDGHDFITNALAAGAAASFSDHPVDVDGPLVLVDDCRAALQRVGGAYRARFEIPIVGITGSVGKTTAKEMIAQGLTAGHHVYKTKGNANSQVGVPITACGIEPEHTAAVIEMGVSMPGEMERIARVVKPTCGVITTIGTSHLEFMGTRENILAEKSHMADYLPAGAPLFVNGDNDLLPGLRSDTYQIVTFGLGEACSWRAEEIAENPEGDGMTFVCVSPEGQGQKVYLPVLGEHNVRNALAAMAVGGYLGQSMEDTARALADYTPPAMRQQTVEHEGVTVIDDSYNASPDSMRSALNVLASRPNAGRKIAVLAGMRELGSYTRQGHLDTGAYAKDKGVELLAVGELGEVIAQGYGDGAVCVKDNAEAAAWLKERLRPGDAVLVKGSRGMKTEEIVAALVNEKGESNA